MASLVPRHGSTPHPLGPLQLPPGVSPGLGMPDQAGVAAPPVPHGSSPAVPRAAAAPVRCSRGAAWRHVPGTSNPPHPLSRQTWWPTSRRASRRRALPDLEGGIKMLEVGTKSRLCCGVRRVVIIPVCMSLLNQCCPQNFGFWQLRRISPTRCAPRRLGGGGGLDSHPFTLHRTMQCPSSPDGPPRRCLDPTISVSPSAAVCGGQDMKDPYGINLRSAPPNRWCGTRAAGPQCPSPPAQTQPPCRCPLEQVRTRGVGPEGALQEDGSPLQDNPRHGGVSRSRAPLRRPRAVGSPACL